MGVRRGNPRGYPITKSPTPTHGFIRGRHHTAPPHEFIRGEKNHTSPFQHTLLFLSSYTGRLFYLFRQSSEQAALWGAVHPSTL